MTHSAALLNRFKGALAGAVVADCLGAHFEYKPTGIPFTKQAVYTFFKDSKSAKLTDRPMLLDEYTDDTAMARSVAQSLIDKSGYDALDMADRFQSEYHREPDRGYGAGVGAVFTSLKNREFADVHEAAKRQFGGSGSYGNGGAMRIVPAALYNYHKSLKESETLVSCITRITHSHAHAVLGALLQHHAVHTALHYPDINTQRHHVAGDRQQEAHGETLDSKSCSQFNHSADSVFQKIPAESRTDAVEHVSVINNGASKGIELSGSECPPAQRPGAEELAAMLDTDLFIEALLDSMRELERNTVPPACEYSDDSDDSDAENNTSPKNKKRKAQAQCRTYCSKLEAMRYLLSTDAGHEEVVRTLGNGIAAFQSVPTAIYAFLRSATPIADIKEITNPMERCVVYAVSLGGDTDTIATMAAAVAGAYYGLDAVPEVWLTRCEGVDHALEQAMKLFDTVGY